MRQLRSSRLDQALQIYSVRQGCARRRLSDELWNSEAGSKGFCLMSCSFLRDACFWYEADTVNLKKSCVLAPPSLKAALAHNLNRLLRSKPPANAGHTSAALFLNPSSSSSFGCRCCQRLASFQLRTLFLQGVSTSSKAEQHPEGGGSRGSTWPKFATSKSWVAC